MESFSRPWGRFEILYADDYSWLKRIIINPGQSLSYQYHLERSEYWVPECRGVHAEVNGREYELQYPPSIVPSLIPPRVLHRLFNPGQDEVSVLEWAVGRPAETDIIRIRDLYGR